MNNRKIKLSIKTKLIIVMIGLIICSLGGYCYYALNSFKNDKMAYIFGSVGNTSETLAQNTHSTITRYFKESFILGSLYNKDKANEVICREIFKKDPALVEYIIYKNKMGSYTPDLRITSETWPTASQSNQQLLEKLNQQEIDFEMVKQKKFEIKNESGDAQILYSIKVFNANENEFYLIRFSGDDLFIDFTKNNAIKNTLLDSTGSSFLLPDENAPAVSRNLASIPYIKEIFDIPSNSGTKEVVKADGSTHLLSFTKVMDYGLIVFSEIPQGVAFKALDKLIKDSVVFGILLVASACFVAVLVANSLIAPIKKLLGGTREIAGGNFDTKITIKSNDEIGVLSDSFNYMAKEILRYTQEIQEKARMANELAVAQLVQSAFFPENDKDFGDIELAGYYTPASECGGDWWGYLEIDNKILMFIGDATGHGVPAALVTATANCCVNLIEDMAKMNPGLLDSPSQILTLLNKVVHKIGGKILMTFYVVVLDKDTLKMTYANASHNAPFVYKYSDSEPSKKDLDVPLCDSGPRLGHKAEGIYPEGSYQLKKGDILLLYTDGIVEAANPEGKLYGERRFGKSFLSAARKSSRQIIGDLLRDGNDFYEGVPVDDDLTLMVVKIKQ